MTQQEIEIENLRASLTEANGKLFEAGKLAGQQSLQLLDYKQRIDRLKKALVMFCDHYLDQDEPYMAARDALKED